MRVQKALKAALWRMRRWLDEGEERDIPSVPFDNTYAWLRPSFQKLRQDPMCASRPAYIWGCLQGAALGKVLGMERVSVLEFGVAGGRGLLTLEHIAERVEEMIHIGIEVYGFDTGYGLPKSQDYRDCPNIWLEGQFSMDRVQLERRLRRASLQLGLVARYRPSFPAVCATPLWPSCPLTLICTIRLDALRLFAAEHDRLLPRVLCYFDDIIGLTYSDYNGERLAISEFNTMHAMRKISPLYGLKFFVPPEQASMAWPNLLYFAHIFDHPLYNQPDELRKPMIMNIEGKTIGYKLAKEPEHL